MMRRFWFGLKHIWEAWKAIARKIGTFQARVLLTLVYGIFVLPFGLFVHLFSDRLRIKRRPTHWLDNTENAADMQWAKRQ